jgi:hypothetical protein
MNFRFSEWWKAISVALVLGVLQGCSQFAPSSGAASWGQVPVGQEEAGRHWYAACFRMPWNGDGRPEWAVDALIARELVLPLLEQHGENIALWRFHRRAGMDSAGHQLTFLMYTHKPVADAVRSQIEENALVASLQRAGYLKGVVSTCRGREPSPAVAAHSDPGWHPQIQKTWPYYIMGVSASWLALVDGVSAEIGDTSEPKSVTELLEHYQAVHKEVTEIWRGQGQHAYIHHLSAVFAYEPLFIQRFIGF